MSFSPSPSTASNPSPPRGFGEARSVRSNTRSNLRGAWLFAILWNLVSAPILFIVPRELERNSLAAIAFIFPLIGAGLLAWAVMITIRWRRFGPSWFDMPLPASLGGVCAGTIRTRLDRPFDGAQGRPPGRCRSARRHAQAHLPAARGQRPRQEPQRSREHPLA